MSPLSQHLLRTADIFPLGMTADVSGAPPKPSLFLAVVAHVLHVLPVAAISNWLPRAMTAGVLPLAVVAAILSIA